MPCTRNLDELVTATGEPARASLTVTFPSGAQTEVVRVADTLGSRLPTAPSTASGDRPRGQQSAESAAVEKTPLIAARRRFKQKIRAEAGTAGPLRPEVAGDASARSAARRIRDAVIDARPSRRTARPRARTQGGPAGGSARPRSPPRHAPPAAGGAARRGAGAAPEAPRHAAASAGRHPDADHPRDHRRRS